eukprot:6009856-Amphidinium_carterae.1
MAVAMVLACVVPIHLATGRRCTCTIGTHNIPSEPQYLQFKFKNVKLPHDCALRAATLWLKT